MAREFSDFESLLPLVCQPAQQAGNALVPLRRHPCRRRHRAHRCSPPGGRRFLAGFPLISYSVAWFSHFVIEKNNPASFGHPLWSLRWRRAHALDDVAGARRGARADRAGRQAVDSCGLSADTRPCRTGATKFATHVVHLRVAALTSYDDQRQREAAPAG